MERVDCPLRTRFLARFSANAVSLERTSFGQPSHHPVDRRPSRLMGRFGGVRIGLRADPAVDPPLEDAPQPGLGRGIAREVIQRRLVQAAGIGGRIARHGATMPLAACDASCFGTAETGLSTLKTLFDSD